MVTGRRTGWWIASSGACAKSVGRARIRPVASARPPSIRDVRPRCASAVRGWSAMLAPSAPCPSSRALVRHRRRVVPFGPPRPRPRAANARRRTVPACRGGGVPSAHGARDRRPPPVCVYGRRSRVRDEVPPSRRTARRMSFVVRGARRRAADQPRRHPPAARLSVVLVVGSGPLRRSSSRRSSIASRGVIARGFQVLVDGHAMCCFGIEM